MVSAEYTRKKWMKILSFYPSSGIRWDDAVKQDMQWLRVELERRMIDPTWTCRKEIFRKQSIRYEQLIIWGGDNPREDALSVAEFRSRWGEWI